MIAADDKAMQEAGETVFKLNRTDSERYLCEARERGRRSWNTLTRQLETAKANLAEKEAALVEKDTVIAELKNTIARLMAER